MSRAQLQAWFDGAQLRNPCPFGAVVPVKRVKPPDVQKRFGPILSVVWEAGLRTFYFKTEEARDEFVTVFNGKAVP